ncbi:L-arabinose transport system permease protein AraQ [Microbacterium lemovicicum]|uniref:L-arabinose transport system permease protein AraQ n=1 Tax=Microbacterium lemovicicum TaxID=1072463 RepID=A0A3Q9J5I4_9MICO|nr:carbohydrate ABC transporter permease [Microbacterium lemovicicum]AZS38252.1 L-arabinose transport system permease protein AraQ [Microbacterium lemovicicum]
MTATLPRDTALDATATLITGAPVPRRRPRTARSRAASVLWHVFSFVLLALLLYPVLWLLGSSFKPGTEILTNPTPIPQQFTLENFEIAFQGVAGLSLWQLLGNSLTISVLSVVGNVVSCALAAYAFARLKFRGRGILFAFMISTIMLPMHVVLIPQFIIFNELGMVGTFLPLVLPKFLATEAFFVFLMVQFIRGIPRDLDEAALIDGAGPYRTFWSVILPLMRPALITTTIFSFIWSWDDFFPQLIYLNRPESFTLQMGLRLFVDQTSASAFGPMFAMSVLAILPVVIFFAIFQRYLVDGVATSGMKG